ncbi:MAG: GntR family transcriptional regulator [Bacillota bacterium]
MNVKEENLTKTNLAYKFIKDKIVNNEFERGEVISENQIADMLEISRSPVRGAFQKLASENLLKIMPSRGAIIKEMSLKEAKDIYDLRMALETFTLTRVFSKISQKDIDKLKKLIELEKIAFEEEKDYMKSMDYDVQFHLYFIKLSGNKEIERLIKNFEDRFAAYGYIALKKPGRIVTTLEEHTDIIKAIEENDFEKSLEKLKYHLKNGKRYALLEN